MRGHVVKKGGEFEIQPRMTGGDQIVIHVANDPAAGSVLSNVAAHTDLSAAIQILGVQKAISILLLARVHIFPVVCRVGPEPVAGRPVARLATHAVGENPAGRHGLGRVAGYCMAGEAAPRPAGAFVYAVSDCARLRSIRFDRSLKRTWYAWECALLDIQVVYSFRRISEIEPSKLLTLPWQASAEHEPEPRNSDAGPGGTTRLAAGAGGSSPRQSTTITMPAKSTGHERARRMVGSG